MTHRKELLLPASDRRRNGALTFCVAGADQHGLSVLQELVDALLPIAGRRMRQRRGLGQLPTKP